MNFSKEFDQYIDTVFNQAFHDYLDLPFQVPLCIVFDHPDGLNELDEITNSFHDIEQVVNYIQVSRN